MKKKLHIHLGPHKTGSTAIQKYLRENFGGSAYKSKIEVISAKPVSEIAAYLVERDFESAGKLASVLADNCRGGVAENLIITSEDIAGDLPGRNARRRPYPQLWRNIQIFERAFSDFECHYYFFIREKEEWLRSAYVQSLKHRTKFSSYEEFYDFIEHDHLWDKVVRKSQNLLGNRFNLIPFRKANDDSSIERFREATGILPADEWPKIDMLRSNTSPGLEVISLLELINKAQCSQHAVTVAKKAILQGFKTCTAATVREHALTPPKSRVDHDVEVPSELEALWKRSKRQVHTQTQPDLLPDVELDWSEHRYAIIEHSGGFPSVGRQNMENQREILRYRFGGFPEVCYLTGLSISYLRRDTQHTQKAGTVFQKLWEEEYPLLLSLLSTRWLISSFQTFAEHGINPEQKQIGTAGFYFGNLMKIYEGERSLEGNSPKNTYPFTHPETESGFHGMDRYSLGGTDLLVNTLSHLVALSTKEKIAGRLLQEFLIRVRRSHTAFSRHDKSRIHHDIDDPQFSNCWSFFEEPS
jgi:hypothetical protein